MLFNITPVVSGYQEIHPYSAMNIEINTSLIMMKECVMRNSSWPIFLHESPWWMSEFSQGSVRLCGSVLRFVLHMQLFEDIDQCCIYCILQLFESGVRVSCAEPVCQEFRWGSGFCRQTKLLAAVLDLKPNQQHASMLLWGKFSQWSCFTLCC